MTCKVENCDHRGNKKGYCPAHYARAIGEVNLPIDAPVQRNPYSRQKREESFLALVDKNVTTVIVDNCWIWKGATNRSNYGTFWNGSQTVSAHRWSYKHFIGPIPKGMELHHLCGNRLCVNPYHLFVLTPGQHRLIHAHQRVMRELECV